MSEEILLHRDLIGRLRDYVNIIDDYDLAADAIENLEEILREQIKEKMQFFWQKVEQDKEISRLRAENEKLREAFGLISTISPNTEVDVNDYIGMAQKIYAANKKLNEELNCWHEAANWPEKSPHDIRTENKKLRAAFRVNMLRAFPSMSHEEIDAEIEAAIREGGNN